jgi:hypothetical protein
MAMPDASSPAHGILRDVLIGQAATISSGERLACLIREPHDPRIKPAFVRNAANHGLP